MLVDSPPVDSSPDAATAPTAPRRQPGVRAAGLGASLVLLAAVAVLGIAVGAKQIPLDQVWHGLFHSTGSDTDVVIRDVRLPRTLLGVLAGAALGLAGTVMQALTRNPLADPGVLGINAGASAAVVSAISFLGVSSLSGYVWFAFAGAAVVSVAVYVLGGTRSATPVRLALAGTALTAVLTGYLNAVNLMDSAALDRMRFWTVGSLATATLPTVTRIAPFLLVGAALALLLARPLTGSPGPNLLPAALMGAALLVGADWATQLLFGADQLPVGVLTGILGGGYLLWLLATERKAGRV
ncbi:iron chelate uptake ABC transporter family permease subunit [Streptomyces noursei]|uniref:iron chelate uptake ABC transporter family permease subunit n=1 Tax=Streptomyces noursei TaxID=1971 RepID=UPI00331DE9E1